MMKSPVFFRCSVCGNIVEHIKDGGGTLVCCGKEMVKLEANTVDASREKHLPVMKEITSTEYNGDKYRLVEVRVGSVDHPMLEEHHIEWILLFDGAKTQRLKLEVGKEPAAKFVVKDTGKQLELYEYCNLHGLWKSVI